ncbi:MAG TPA: hypothetical protein VE861_08255, partial [Gemmatimonadaceae bacterium]|nr:hypothetical protein [Gemmatimonadaceae bacterium]
MLYGAGNTDAGLLGVTYGEIIEALIRYVPAFDVEDVALLGAHGSTAEERVAIAGTRDAEVSGVMRAQFDQLSGLLPGDGDGLRRVEVSDVSRGPVLERALARLLRRAAHGDGTAARRIDWVARDATVVHRLHDRRAASRVYAARSFGAPPPLLFNGCIAERQLHATGLTIYVDVSGSMNALLPHLRRALHALRREISPTLYWFSTKVVPARPRDLETGRMQSTGGTSIAAVMRHIAETVPAGTPVAVLTDGYIETVAPAVSRPILTRRTSVHVGVLGGGPLHDDAAWVTSSTRLPTPQESR